MIRLGMKDIKDEHLYWLMQAAYHSVGASAAQWLAEVDAGLLELWEAPEGLLGIADKEDRIFVEFLAGRGFAKDPKGLRDRLLELSKGRPIEAATKRMGLVRLMSRAGFELTAVFMRYDNGRR